MFFLGIVLYVYDRFLLPVALVLALFGGTALARALRARSWWGRGVAAAVLAFGLARSVSVDVLLGHDSRYAVEEWLRREVGPDRWWRRWDHSSTCLASTAFAGAGSVPRPAVSPRWLRTSSS